MRRYTTADAISKLRPNASFEMLHDQYDNLVWHSPEIDIPSKEEVEQQLEAMKQEALNLLYREKRMMEYPSTAEQLDILYHQGYDGWKAVIEQVKLKYPKP